MSSFTKYSNLPPYAEIANLEHELAVLKERRANLHRVAKVALPALILTIGVAILLFIYAIVTDNSRATAALSLIFAVVIFGVLFAWVVKGTSLEKYFSVTPFDGAYGHGAHARFVEAAIAGREQRLAELKSQQ